MAAQPLDPQEWDSVLGKMLRYHLNISEEIKVLITQIRKEMKPELVPVAEDRANYGKIVKKMIRSMWGLEYEIVDVQEAFAKQMGNIDINNLTDDFVEEMMLQSKPLQGILYAIREKQKAKLEEVMKEYKEHIENLEPMTVPRPPKPEPKPEPPKEEKKEEKPAEKKEGEEKPAEPAPAVDAAAAPPAVEASA